jgi:Aldehyde dehydrogenase family
MDKPTPKSDVFKANRDRVAPLLATLQADGIRHMIDGKSVASISGATFETQSPVDGAALASVARGNAEDIDRAATAAALAFKSWREIPATLRKKLLHRVATRSRIAPTISRCSNASIPARLIVSWRRPRSGPPKISASSQINARMRAMAGICRARSIGMYRRGCPSGRSV